MVRRRSDSRRIAIEFAPSLERTNGLTYAAGKMKGSPLCYQLTMMANECERSPLALDAIQRL